jgi:hypothetical protein
VRGLACGDCVVTFLLGSTPQADTGGRPGVVDLDHEERAALSVLADSGLVPPLRLVRPLGSARSVATEPQNSESGNSERSQGNGMKSAG